MSWVALCIPAVGEQAMRAYSPLLDLPSFGQCSYCKRLPDTNQTHANCISCGAPLPQSTTSTMNYSNHDSRKKDEKKYASKKGVYNRPAPTPGAYTPPATDYVYVPNPVYISTSDTSSSDSSSSCDCGSSDGGGCGGGGE